MGFIDDAKETLDAAATKVSRAVEDGVDRVQDKADEVKADAEVKRAEAEADSVHKRNDIKEQLRD
jgi:hypothetical protein